MIIQEGLTFDDVLLIPQHSSIKSRSDVDTSVQLPKEFKVATPIIPANMKTVTEFEMAKAIFKMGGMALVHRFMPEEEQLEIIRKLIKEYGTEIFNKIGLSVGIKKGDYEIVDKFVKAGVKILCVDVAHGDSELCIEMCKYIASKYQQVLLIAGSVATAEGAKRLWESGVDIVKVGIGNGSICTTRVETGNGVPLLSSLINIYNIKQDAEQRLGKELKILCDGGIRNSGDCVKALCFADIVMSGNCFAGSEEAPGDIIQVNGKYYKSYRGSSTHKISHIEGVVALVPVKERSEIIMRKLLEGIRSGCSYQGVNSIKDLKNNPHFIKITNAGIIESKAHDVLVVE